MVQRIRRCAALAGLCLVTSCGGYTAATGWLALTGLIVWPSGGQSGFLLNYGNYLVTSETGTTATFQVALRTQPTAPVSVELNISSGAEVSVSPSSFTLASMTDTQTVTVTGIDDAALDGNVFYVINGTSSSPDASYNGLTMGQVPGLSMDDEQRRVSAAPLTLSVSENLTTASFSVALSAAPGGNVIVDVASLDLTEGTVSPASLTFTTANWFSPQIVTVTGVNDFARDGTQAYNVTLGINGASDATYTCCGVVDTVALSTTDNDTPGITISPSSINTSEGGVTQTISVVLNSLPSANVTVYASSTDTTEGTLAPLSRTFTAGNWNVPQNFTLTPQTDALLDGTISYNITMGGVVSGDADYNGMALSPVSVSNADAGVPGITVNPTSGLVTGEGGVNTTFTMVLTQMPSANVSVGVSSSDTTEGTVSPASITFTAGACPGPGNWCVPQTVNVNGANDAVLDGNIGYTIVTAAATSTDGNYSGLDPSDVTATNNDNDANTVDSNPTGNLYTSEGGGTVTVNVVLGAQPAADVDVGPISVSTAAEATVSPGTLTFTSANWSTPQAITITGVTDALSDGTQVFTVDLGSTTSLDLNYNAIAPTDYNGGGAGQITARNCDTTPAAVIVLCNPSAAYATTEAGGAARLFMVLKQAPSANVTIPLSSSDLTEFTVSTASLTFTAANWNIVQSFTVNGVDDSIVDGTIGGTLQIGAAVSGDGAFSGQDLADRTVNNADNDTAGFSRCCVSGNTTELGGTATFDVVLTAQPTADVTIPIASLDLTEGTVSPASLTFTNANWNVAQTVTVTGVDDTTRDGNIAFNVQVGMTSSADGAFNNLAAQNQSVTNQDNERYIYITGTLFDGDFDNNAALSGGTYSAVNGDSNPLAELDNACQTDGAKPAGNYRAFIGSGSLRRASQTANAGDSQVSWVLTPSYNYIRSTGVQIFQANASAILPFGALVNSVSLAATPYWTGLAGDWTAGNHCSNWSDNGGGNNGTDGDATSTAAASISNSSNVCTTTRRLLCAEQ